MDTLSKTSTAEENNTDQSINWQTSSPNYIESLPVDVLFDILSRVPAQDIHNSTQLVCRKWYKITNTRDFKHAHLHQSTFGLLPLSDTTRSQQKQLMTLIATAGSKADDDLIEISNLNYRPQEYVLSSCNGLVLVSRNLPGYLYITNPSTKQKLDLPLFFSEKRFTFGCAITYVATTMEYKVVCAVKKSPLYEPPDFCVAMSTVGVDKDWTCRVNTQHLSRQAKKRLLDSYLLTTQGFVHWAPNDGMVRWDGPPEFVFTLNVETEIITQFPVPSLRLNDIGIYTQVNYLPMGSYLSMLILCSEYSWELWEMKPETGEWTEMPSIDLEDQFVSSRSYVLMPFGWLRPREVLLFKVGERHGPSRFVYFPAPFCFAFTVRTCKLQKFELDIDWINRCLVHRNSLVWIDGC